jgi:ssDNA-binding Zn-finger/Zn-ribbon topoisomerase 1
MASQDSAYAGPINFFGNDGKTERYVNPFYGIPLQYLPLNIDGMLWWAQHLLFRNGFYKTALARVANYFITQLKIETDDSEGKDKYQEAFDQLNWKQELSVAGLNTLAYGNEFISINQGFDRFLRCPKCDRSTNIKRIADYEFHKNEYSWKCPKCGTKEKHKVVDMANKNVEDIRVVHWPVREIKLRYDETTGATEYYWDIPEDYATKVAVKNNKFYSKHVPKMVYDCIFSKGGRKMLAFNSKNFIHLKVPTPSSLKTDGKAIPPCLFMFDDFFMYQTLKRFNEVICFEDINPFRVISMDSGSNPAANPIFHQDSGSWGTAVEDMIEQHRRDPGSYHKFPFPIQYQQLGGEGKQLAPTELLNQAKSDILSALNIPQELFTMNLQTQAVGPSLRLFENSWSVLPNIYNQLLQHWADVIGKIKGFQKAKVSLIPVTFSDDMERKSVIGQLVSANAIARSELLNLYGFDYKDQIRKKMQEDADQEELQEEEQQKKQLEEANKDSIFGPAQQQGGGGGSPGGGGSGGGSTPDDTLAQAQQIAQQLFPLGPAERRTELQQIKATNQTLWSAVKAALQEMTSQAKSQGVQSAQQGQQGGGAGAQQQPGAQ